MTLGGSFVRRNFEPLVLSVQVLVDLAVILLACYAGYELREYLFWGRPTDLSVYREIFLLTAAVTLVCFHAFGMYSPLKSLLNIEEFKAIAKSSIVSFLVVHMLLVLLRGTTNLPDKGIYKYLLRLHHVIDLETGTDDIPLWPFSRITLVTAFLMIFVFTTVSRFISFRAIQYLHRRGVGNRNVLIYGTGTTARRLQKKFVQVPTLGLNLAGFVSEQSGQAGDRLERSVILGAADELEWLVRKHKVSEVFVAMPEASEERIMEIVEQLDQLGVVYHVVPRFYHLLTHKVRIESLDSIPLISRPDRSRSLLGAFAKRTLDIVVSSLVLTVGALDNETVLCLPALVFFLLFRGFRPRDLVRPVAITLGTALPGFLAQGTMRYITRHQPHLGGAWHLPANVGNILRELTWSPVDYFHAIYLYPLFIFGALWLYACLGFRDKPEFVARSLWLVPLFVIPNLVTGIISEVREMIPLAFIIIPAAMFWMFPGSDHRMPAGTTDNP